MKKPYSLFLVFLELNDYIIEPLFLVYDIYVYIGQLLKREQCALTVGGPAHNLNVFHYRRSSHVHVVAARVPCPAYPA